MELMDVILMHDEAKQAIHEMLEKKIDMKQEAKII